MSGPLFGRSTERQALGAALADTIAGRGSLTVISGESGAGKSSLAASICRDAVAAGAVVLVGRCFDVSFTPLYGAWVDLFADLERATDMPPLPAAFARTGTLDAGTNQPALFDEVRSFLGTLSSAHPVVLLLEDLQWADLASCELFRHVARAAAAQRLMIIATVSDDTLNHAQPLYRLLPAIEREAAARHLALAPLRPEHLHELVATSYPLPPSDAARLVAYVHAMTRGNALFVVELLRALEEQGQLNHSGAGWTLEDLGRVTMPFRLRQVIDNRLMRLPENDLDLLAAAAVIGPEVGFSLWADTFGPDEETMLGVLEGAAEAHLVEPTPDGTGFRFVHALVHEALYERIFPVRRRVMHRRVAEALADSATPDPDAIARHFFSADDDRAAVWLIRAGKRAEAVGALRTAVERYEAALRPLEKAGAPAAEQARVLLDLALLRRMDDSWRAVTYIDMATRVAAEANEPDLSARLLLGRGIVRCYAGMIVEGIEDLTAGVAAVDRLPPTAPAAHPGISSADVLLNQGSLVYWLAVVGLLERARTVAATHLRGPAGPVVDDGRTAGVANSQWGLGLVHALQGRPAEADQAFTAAAAAHQDLDQHRLAFIVLRDELVYVTLVYRTDDHVERERVTAELRRMADQGTAARAFVDAIDNFRYPLLHMMAVEGRWDEVHQVVDAMGEYGIPILRHVVGSVLGPIARAQGDADLAWRLVREAWLDGPSTEPGRVECYHTLPQQRLAVELSLDAGDLPAALAWLDAHDRLLRWAGAVQGMSEASALRARYELAAGNPGQARRYAERALDLATQPRQPLALLKAHLLLGELATSTERPDVAAAHLDAALALSVACAAPYERALTLLARAELGLVDGPEQDVLDSLTQAEAILRTLEAGPALQRVADLTTCVAGRPPVAVAYPAGLTEREAEVLGLLAQGLSDKEIAALLHLSPRTVGRHVEKAYRKVGAHRRAEAAGFAIRHGLVREDVPHGGRG